DLAAQIGHAGAVDEAGLDDEPFRQAEREGAGHRPALEHRLLRHVLHVHEEGLGEPAEVHEGGDVRIADGAGQRLVPCADLVLLVGQALLHHPKASFPTVADDRSGAGITRAGWRILPAGPPPAVAYPDTRSGCHAVPPRTMRGPPPTASRPRRSAGERRADARRGHEP